MQIKCNIDYSFLVHNTIILFCMPLAVVMYLYFSPKKIVPQDQTTNHATTWLNMYQYQVTAIHSS